MAAVERVRFHIYSQVNAMSAEKTLCASYWPEPIRVVSEVSSRHGFVTIEATGLESGQHYTATLPSAEWDRLE